MPFRPNLEAPPARDEQIRARRTDFVYRVRQQESMGITASVETIGNRCLG
jgi:hypothetical protein